MIKDTLAAAAMKDTDVTLAGMWQKSPILTFVLLLTLIPLAASFVFGFYVMQQYNGAMGRLTNEMEKQTVLLMDIKDEIRDTEMRNLFKSTQQQEIKPNG